MTKFLSKEGCLTEEMRNHLFAIYGDRAPSLYSD